MGRRCLFVGVLFGAVLFFCSPKGYADCYSETVNFDPNLGYSWNHAWTHYLPLGGPSGCLVESAEIQIRAQVWSWGSYPYEQDVLASDTNIFNYSEGYVCSLNPSTHPSPSHFYTITCTLDQNQLEWLSNHGQINFQMVTFGGTYYLDYSTLTVCCSDLPECECDLNHDGSCNILDWPYFIEDWGRTDCHDLGVDCECDLNADGSCNILDWPYFIEDWGRTDCPVYP
jgi:hypothetical protein